MSDPAAEALARALRRARGVRYCPGTVVAVDTVAGAYVYRVTTDDSTTPIAMGSLVDGWLSPGRRVMVAFTAPHGAWIVGVMRPAPAVFFHADVSGMANGTTYEPLALELDAQNEWPDDLLVANSLQAPMTGRYEFAATMTCWTPTTATNAHVELALRVTSGGSTSTKTIGFLPAMAANGRKAAAGLHYALSLDAGDSVRLRGFASFTGGSGTAEVALDGASWRLLPDAP